MTTVITSEYDRRQRGNITISYHGDSRTMNQLLFLSVLIAVLCVLTSARPKQQTDDFDLDREEAVKFLKRTIFHPGKTKCEEQKREASEKYEERCEPSVNKFTGKRYCPNIKTWAAFKNYEVGGGYGR